VESLQCLPCMLLELGLFYLKVEISQSTEYQVPDEGNCTVLHYISGSKLQAKVSEFYVNVCVCIYIYIYTHIYIYNKELQIPSPVFKQIHLFLLWMFLAELTAWMFKHLLSVDCSHLYEELMFNCESAQMNIAIQTCCQEDTAIYHQVHQLCLPSLFHGERDTRIIWNYLKKSDIVRRTMRKMWVKCCHLDDGTLLALLSIMTCCQMPNLFLQIDRHAFALVLPLACRCQHTVPSRMDIPSRTATYPLCKLCHSQSGQMRSSTWQVILWTLKFLLLSMHHSISV
jgi:hypothetical protein